MHAHSTRESGWDDWCINLRLSRFDICQKILFTESQIQFQCLDRGFKTRSRIDIMIMFHKISEWCVYPTQWTECCPELTWARDWSLRSLAAFARGFLINSQTNITDNWKYVKITSLCAVPEILRSLAKMSLRNCWDSESLIWHFVLQFMISHGMAFTLI
jgi:hypothetical protein